MKSVQYLISRILYQLLALLVLHVALQWLLPYVAASLMAGMLLWSNAGLVFCWSIQYGCIMASFEFRETMVKKAEQWLIFIPVQKLKALLLLSIIFSLLVMLAAITLCLRIQTIISFATVIELLLLGIQIWILCVAVAPFSAGRFYTLLWLHRGAAMKKNSIINKNQVTIR